MVDKIELALQIAMKCHAGQKDKRGETYILHPLWVLSHFDDEESRIVAILHDVVEDFGYPLELIEMYFGKIVHDAVEAITKKKNEDYFEYIYRVKQNSIATRVKIKDLQHNMIRVVGDSKEIERQRKYMRAHMILSTQPLVDPGDHYDDGNGD